MLDVSRYTRDLVSNSETNRKSHSLWVWRGLNLYFSRSMGAQNCQPGSGQLMKPGHTSLFLLCSRSKNSVILRKVTKRGTEAAVICVCGFMGANSAYLLFNQWMGMTCTLNLWRKHFTQASEKCEESRKNGQWLTHLVMMRMEMG